MPLLCFISSKLFWTGQERTDDGLDVRAGKSRRATCPASLLFFRQAPAGRRRPIPDHHKAICYSATGPAIAFLRRSRQSRQSENCAVYSLRLGPHTIQCVGRLCPPHSPVSL